MWDHIIGFLINRKAFINLQLTDQWMCTLVFASYRQVKKISIQCTSNDQNNKNLDQLVYCADGFVFVFRLSKTKF